MFLQRLSVSGVETSPYYQSSTFNKAKGTINDLPNCTCYCMCRVYESLDVDKPFPMFVGRSAGGYPAAKQWYNDTTFAKGSELKEGSIAVFDGNSGHVAYVEKVISKNRAIISQSQYDPNKSLRNYKYWEKREVELTVGKATMSGIGPLIGFIYLPIEDLRTKRDANFEQIEITEDMVNVRISPNDDPFTQGCYIPTGIYNILSRQNDGTYYWYEVETNHWVREGSWLQYYPKSITNEELIKENEALRKENATLSNDLAAAYAQLDQIRAIVN